MTADKTAEVTAEEDEQIEPTDTSPPNVPNKDEKPTPIGRPVKDELVYAAKGPTKTVIEIGADKVDLSEAVDLPSNRVFRDAWALNAEAIEIDMPAAREIKRQQLRDEREPILNGLDVDWMRASEQGDQAAAAGIAALKQKYRDATEHENIENAANADALAAITLESLIT